MISIKNLGGENLVVRQILNADAPGCRVIDVPEPQILKPGQEIQVLGYEPGITWLIKPQTRPEIPRSYLQPGGDPYNRVGFKAVP